MSFDVTTIIDDINIAEEVAQKLAPFLFLIPGISPYVAAITAAIPEIVKATQALESAIPTLTVGSVANTQAVADHINPNLPSNPALSG